VDVGGQLGGQPAAPAPGRAGDGDEPSRAVLRLRPSRSQAAQLDRSTHERLDDRFRERRGQLGVRNAPVEGDVVLEDRLLEAPKLGPRLDPDLGQQRAPSVAVDIERVRLATAAVQRQHEVLREPLACRVRRDELAQLRDELGVAPALEVGCDARLDRGQPRLLEPGDGRLGERLEREVGERRPAPQRERRAQRGRRLVAAPIGERRATVFEELVEAVGVEFPRLHAQPVAPGRGHEDLGVAERLAQPRDVDLRGAHRALGTVGSPQRERQPLRADRLVGMQQQHREHRARLATPQDDGTGCAVSLDRPEDPVLHDYPLTRLDDADPSCFAQPR
jgi:hypothetical protein